MSEELSLEGILFAEPSEGRESLVPSEGELPAGLEGSYYLNGPANLQRGEFRYRHWLDGDGFVRAVHFRDGKAEMVSRFVRTKKFADETRAGEPLYRAFGTSFPNDRLRRRIALESPANVSVFPYGGKLFAFGEQALPWELNRETLETIGEFNFNGELIEISPFSAHPKIDRASGRWCNFGLKYLLKGTTLCYWEFDESFRKVMGGEFTLPRPVSIHDFALCEKYAAFYMSPYDLDIGSFIRSGTSIHDSLTWHEGESNTLFLVPREGSKEPISIDLGARGFCLHLIDAFMSGDDLVVDLIETSEPLYPQYAPLPELFSTVRPGAIIRLTVSPHEASVRKVETYPYPEDHLDFPIGRSLMGNEESLDVWVLAVPVKPEGQTKYFDRLQRFNWSRGLVVDEYTPPVGAYLAGEAALIERAGDGIEDDILICPVWNARNRTTPMQLFRAYDLAAGPITSLPAPSESPLAFHASYAFDS